MQSGALRSAPERVSLTEGGHGYFPGRGGPRADESAAGAELEVVLSRISLAALLGAGALASPAWAAVPGTSPQPTVSAGNGQITVTFTAPATDGGKSITSYTASCTPINSNNGIFAQEQHR